MYHIAPTLFFASVALAWPKLIPRKYGKTGTDQVLRPELQAEWYRTVPGQKSNVRPPADPSSFYTCIGPNADNFLKPDQWITWPEMWAINAPEITKSNGGDQYNAHLELSIREVGYATKIDSRLILAMIMNESTGNMNINCTGENRCGILQHGGAAKFDPNNAKDSIKQMISEAIYGSSVEEGAPKDCPGFLTYFNGENPDLTWLPADGFWRGNPFAAGHLYNLGDIKTADLTAGSDGKPGMSYYAHDMLSRLQGWNGWAEGCEASKKCGELQFADRACGEVGAPPSNAPPGDAPPVSLPYFEGSSTTVSSSSSSSVGPTSDITTTSTVGVGTDAPTTTTSAETESEESSTSSVNPDAEVPATTTSSEPDVPAATTTSDPGASVLPTTTSTESGAAESTTASVESGAAGNTSTTSTSVGAVAGPPTATSSSRYQ